MGVRLLQAAHGRRQQLDDGLRARSEPLEAAAEQHTRRGPALRCLAVLRRLPGLGRGGGVCEAAGLLLSGDPLRSSPVVLGNASVLLHFLCAAEVASDAELEPEELAPELGRVGQRSEAPEEERARRLDVPQLQLAVRGEEPEVHLAGVVPDGAEEDAGQLLRAPAAQAEVDVLVPEAHVRLELERAAVEDENEPLDSGEVADALRLPLQGLLAAAAEALERHLVADVVQVVLGLALPLLEAVLEVSPALDDVLDLRLVEDLLPPEVVELLHHVLEDLLHMVRHGRGPGPRGAAAQEPVGGAPRAP
mmetsp:Transcript_78259/g.221251  ORF Transcript_78259/g.221251 Transcript_78259/m.221251 type:complete len:306 (-) Transcript_78259:16-933(-)